MKNLEGRAAPSFKLKGSDGKKHALGDYKGKYVVIYFYPKDDTPGCTKESCSFRDLHRQISGLNAVVLGVSKDDLPSHEKFIEKFELPFVLLSDPGKDVMKAYGAWGPKISYGKESVGTIRSTVLVGPDGVVLKHWTSVTKAEEHPAAVLAALETAAS
jgi:peroxiredoxin Q/BCP